jgi:hypothetical protein
MHGNTFAVLQVKSIIPLSSGMTLICRHSHPSEGFCHSAGTFHHCIEQNYGLLGTKGKTMCCARKIHQNALAGVQTESIIILSHRVFLIPSDFEIV